MGRPRNRDRIEKPNWRPNPEKPPQYATLAALSRQFGVGWDALKKLVTEHPDEVGALKVRGRWTVNIEKFRIFCKKVALETAEHARQTLAETRQREAVSRHHNPRRRRTPTLPHALADR